MSKHEEREASLKILELVNALLAKDATLRETHHIGDKFRYVRHKLETLQQYVQAELKHVIEEVLPGERVVLEDERVIYIYLFNAQGLSLPNWKKMMHPSVFYEYSINRPIYGSESDVKAFIRHRSNKGQHGYLAVVVKKTDVISENVKQDAIGSKVLRVREGCLKLENVLFFFHNDLTYVLSNGDFLKK